MLDKRTLLLLGCFLVGGIFPETSWTHDNVRNEYLDMDLSQLMEIVVTSVSKKPQVLKDAAAAAYVITQEDIRRSGVTTVADALAMAPGIHVAKISSSKWSVSSRGFPGYTSNKLLVMIDGRSVYSPSYSGTVWDMNNILLEDIERIEVVRGPGGTLWGANAVNGVINIISRKAQDTLGYLVRGGVGTEERFQVAGRSGFVAAEGVYARVFGFFNDRDENVGSAQRSPGQSSDGNDGWNNGQVGFRLDRERENGNEWTLQGDLFKSAGDQTVAPYWTYQPPYLSEKRGELENRGGNLLGRWAHTTTGGEKLTLQSYLDYYSRDDDYYGQSVITCDAELQYEYSLTERNNVTMGVGIRRIDADFDSTDQIRIADQDSTLYSAFIQDEIMVVENLLWLTPGIKYEHNDFTGDEWQPSVRMLWKPGNSQTVWASLSRAVRTPSMIEQSGKVTMAIFPVGNNVGQINVVGTDDFGSEEVLAYELGYRQQITDFMGMDIALFYNNYDDIYTVSPEPNRYGYDLSLINGLCGYSYGLEVAIDWHVSPDLNLKATYSFLDPNLKPKPGVESVFGEDYFNGVSPQNQVSFQASYQIVRDLQVNVWLRYIDNFTSLTGKNGIQSPDPLLLGDYFQLDANIMWSPVEDLEVMISGQNLLQESHMEFFSEHITPPTEIERGAYLKITYRF